MPAEQPLPGGVAERSGEGRGANDIGEEERPMGVDGDGPSRDDRRQLGLGRLLIQSGAEPPELLERRLELEVRRIPVSEGAQSPSQQGLRPGYLVGSADVAPGADGHAQLAGRRSHFPLGQAHPTDGFVTRSFQGRRGVGFHDAIELLRGRASEDQVAGGDRDLDLGRQEPGT